MYFLFPCVALTARCRVGRSVSIIDGLDTCLIVVRQNYFVEVDIVMDATTPLWKAHDVSQQLQDKLETLPNVERAFVHVDHETDHTPVGIHLSALRPTSLRSVPTGTSEGCVNLAKGALGPHLE